MLRTIVVSALALAIATPAAAQTRVASLPDTTGWGVHVLTVARDSQGGIWAGTYGRGIYHLPANGADWRRIESDTTDGSISWDFVHALAFGPRGQIWYGTIGNGWGVSLDGGRSWRNWTFGELGPEWQYVAPGGIVTRGDTTMVGTADGILVTTDDGARWTALIDSTGPAARGPADSAHVVLANEYVLRVGTDRSGWLVEHLHGTQRLLRGSRGWEAAAAGAVTFPEHQQLAAGTTVLHAAPCGLLAEERLDEPCLVPGDRGAVQPADAPRPPLTTWFARPVAPEDNEYIDQTYRYGSTMGGNFQQHQGIEFNNPDGTPVHAIGGGVVVWAGPAEQGALTVAIRHDSTIASARTRDTLRIYSVYYHNSALDVAVGDTVRTGQRIARVGHTGRATNDHLHLEVHAAPVDSTALVVNPEQRFPPYTTNPELWIAPLEGTGIVAGQVFDSAGAPVQQARVYGLTKTVPIETPFSFAETYGSRAHPHPLYAEHFAVGDVSPGTYLLAVDVAEGVRVYREITVEAGQVTWVVFRP
jgi:hypothetical protein